MGFQLLQGMKHRWGRIPFSFSNCFAGLASSSSLLTCFTFFEGGATSSSSSSEKPPSSLLSSEASWLFHSFLVDSGPSFFAGDFLVVLSSTAEDFRLSPVFETFAPFVAIFALERVKSMQLDAGVDSMEEG